MNNIVYNCDCVEYMRTLPDKYFDLACADPNYGIGMAANPVRQKHEKKDWDNKTPDKEFFDELFRVSKNQIIWGGNYFGLPPNKHFLIWDKMQPFDFSLAMCEYAWSSFDSPAKMFRQHVSSNGEKKIHPTQKSIALYAWIFKTTSKKVKPYSTRWSVLVVAALPLTNLVLISMVVRLIKIILTHKKKDLRKNALERRK